MRDPEVQQYMATKEGCLGTLAVFGAAIVGLAIAAGLIAWLFLRH